MFVVIGDILIEVWADFDSVRNMQIGFSLKNGLSIRSFAFLEAFYIVEIDLTFCYIEFFNQALG